MSLAYLSFKEHAFAVYGTAGVGETCVALQDRHALDVVMMLYLCWLGRHGVSLDTDSLEKAIQAVEGWREEVVLPIRRVRRALKTDVGIVAATHSNALRQTIKDAEIAAEVLQMTALEHLAESLLGRDARSAERHGVVRGNLSRYLDHLSVARESETVRDLELLIEAAMAV